MDVNDVRLRSLRAAARVLLSEIVRDAHEGSPEWFTIEDRVQWAFTMGQIHVALARVVGSDPAEPGLRGLRASCSMNALDDYRSMSSCLESLLSWCADEASPNRPTTRSDAVRALAAGSVAARLRHLLHEAPRAPCRFAASHRVSSASRRR